MSVCVCAWLCVYCIYIFICVCVCVCVSVCVCIVYIYSYVCVCVFVCVCVKGECGAYSSTGYMLLGLILVFLDGATTWQDLDQSLVIPESVKHAYTGIAFPTRGRCSSIPNVVHQYASHFGTAASGQNASNVTTTPPITFRDIYNNSCVNGWTCGNVVTRPIDAARFHYDLHALKIVSQQSLDMMTTFTPMENGWAPQTYGEGLMITWPFRNHSWAPDPSYETTVVGHAGRDYGSMAQMAGFNTKYKFGFVVASNTIISANCSRGFNDTLGWVPYFADTVCAVFNAILPALSNGAASKLDCASCPNCPFNPKMTATCTRTLDQHCHAARKNSTKQCEKCTFAQPAYNASVAAGCTKTATRFWCTSETPNSYPTTPPQCTWDI